MQDKLINLSTGLEDLIQQANDLIRAAKAPSTRKAYQSDFRIFESWCEIRTCSLLRLQLNPRSTSFIPPDFIFNSSESVKYSECPPHHTPCTVR